MTRRAQITSTSHHHHSPMHSFTNPLISLWTSFFLLLLLHTSPTTSSPLQPRCINSLQNPSFESGISPWLTIVQGSFTSTRGVYTSAGGGRSGANFYYALSNASVEASLTVSQTGFGIDGGNGRGGDGSVDCSAWVASRRPGNVGSTRVEVFLDGVSCGLQYLGTSGWTKVGGRVKPGPESTHTVAVVFISDQAGEEGWSLWLDDIVVGQGC